MLSEKTGELGEASLDGVNGLSRLNMSLGKSNQIFVARQRAIGCNRSAGKACDLW